MNFIPSRAPLRNQPNFELRDAAERPATAAGTHLFRRYHVAAGIADLVALLAGLGASEEARRQ
jgi:hypothetical protein